MLRDLDVPPARGPAEAVASSSIHSGVAAFRGRETEGRRGDAPSSPSSSESLPQNAESLVPLKETNAAIL